MPSNPQLEVYLHRADEGEYAAEIRYNHPNDLTRHSPVRGKVKINFLQLRQKYLDAEAYGKILTEALLEDTRIREDIDKILAISRQSQERLSIRIYIDPNVSELHGLRWETMIAPDKSEFLFLDENIPCSRIIEPEVWNKSSLKEKVGLRALVVVANPNDLAEGKFQVKDTDQALISEPGKPEENISKRVLTPVDVVGEVARAKRALKNIHLDILASQYKEGVRVTFNNILDQLRMGYDILYFAVHGALVASDPRDRETSQGSLLWIEDEEGFAQIIEGDRLVRALGRMGYLERPLLVVLASCQSSGTGSETKTRDGGALAALGPQLVRAGVPAVVAMQGNISMKTVEEFMPRFFTELLRHGEVDHAMAAARAAVVHRYDWWMPVLFSHLQDNRLFKPTTGGIAQSLRILHYEPETVYIPAGSFLMGADKKVAVEAFESPMHEVNLPAFRIGCYPITNAEFSEFIRQTGRLIPITAGWEGQYPPVNKRSYPISGITWYDAVAYCRWLSEQTGRHYGLPSEAQWEKAARGLDGFVYPWGDEWEDERCNFGNFTVAPVDAYPAQNEYGCFDLVGNVRQWTSSLWGERRLEPDPRYAYPWKMDGRNNLDAERYIRRVCRGGGVLDEISAMRCCARSNYLPNRHGPPGKRIGFRVVLYIDES